MAYRDWTRKGFVQGDTVEIIIRDSSGAKLETFKFVTSDRNAHREAGRVLMLKYGINFADLRDRKPKKDKDIEWLKGNDDFY